MITPRVLSGEEFSFTVFQHLLRDTSSFFPIVRYFLTKLSLSLPSVSAGCLNSRSNTQRPRVHQFTAYKTSTARSTMSTTTSLDTIISIMEKARQA
jgi:hypothetical protein